MLYVRDIQWIDPQTFILDSMNLAVEPGPHGHVHLNAELPVELLPGDMVVEGKGRLATRALACGHHHVYSALSRGMPPAPQPCKNFLDILEQVWWRLDKKLDRDMIAASAEAVALFSLKNGVAFVIDHHASPFAVSGSLETIAQAFDKIGVGHMLCYEMSCRDGEEVKEEGLEESERYLASGRKGHVGLHASFTVDDDLCQRAVALAQKYGTGLHIHVAESVADQEQCLAHYGKRVVERLNDLGVLAVPGSILGHCVHINPAERALIQASPCYVVQNVESNLNNNVGLGTYHDLPRVFFGTDGMHSDMLRSAQAAYFTAQQAHDSLSPLQACQRLNAVHTYVAHMQAPGNSNNVVLFDYDSPTPVTNANLPGHFMFGLSSRNVHAVISQGRLVLEAGRLLTTKEADVLAFAREQARRLWDKLEN